MSLPVMGLTATASTSVLDDVSKHLMIKPTNMITFRGAADRPNIYYEVVRKPPVYKECIALIVDMIKTRYAGQTGIIYCMTRNDAVKVSNSLNNAGITSLYYHGDVCGEDRQRYQHMWSTGHIQLMVATVAFGLGINKDNVRFIIHHSISKGMENYYQESGRAGRDGERCECVILYRLADVFKLSVIIGRHPCTVSKLYRMIGWCVDVVKCRRSSMYHILEEEEEEGHLGVSCLNMCDNCHHKQKVEVINITLLLDVITGILTSGGNCTSQQLITAIAKEGGAVCESLSLLVPSGIERCIAHLLINGLLYEEDHFTPYNTISYLRINTDKVSECREEGVLLDVSLPVSELTSHHSHNKPTSGGRKRKRDTSSQSVYTPAATASKKKQAEVYVIDDVDDHDE